MMVKPPLKKLESQVDSKYTLVTLAAKHGSPSVNSRARLAANVTKVYLLST